MKKAELAPIKAEVSAIYKDLELISVQRDCTMRTQCCQFQRTGRTPMLTKGEALYAALGVRASGKKSCQKVRTDPAPCLAI